MNLSTEAQIGIERFCAAVAEDGDPTRESPSSRNEWAWLCYLLKAAPDTAEWFPKGKWATIQEIERQLDLEAHRTVGPACAKLIGKK